MHSADRNRHSQRQRRGSDTYTPWRIIAVLPLSIFSQWYAKAITTSVVDCIERFVGISSGPPVAISDMAFFFFSLVSSNTDCKDSAKLWPVLLVASEENMQVGQWGTYNWLNNDYYPTHTQKSHLSLP